MSFSQYGHDQLRSKAERAELEKSKRVISGFEVCKDWSAKPLEKDLAALRWKDSALRSGKLFWDTSAPKHPQWP